MGAKNSSASEQLKHPISSLWNSRGWCFTISELKMVCLLSNLAPPTHHGHPRSVFIPTTQLHIVGTDSGAGNGGCSPRYHSSMCSHAGQCHRLWCTRLEHCKRSTTLTATLCVWYFPTLCCLYTEHIPTKTHRKLMMRK